MTKADVEALEKLGLGKHEARIYAALMAESPCGAALLARRCGLPRSSVYTTLEVLQSKGLVGTTYRGEVKQFVVEGHRAIVDHLERERDIAQARVVAAEALRDRFAKRAGDAQDGIVSFEGQEGLRRIYLAMLREARPGGVMSIVRDEFIWTPEWTFVRERAWMDRVRRLKADRDLSTRLLVNPSATEREHHAYYRSRTKLEVRSLPPALAVTHFALYLVDEAAAILSVEKGRLVGVKISDRHLARNLAVFFTSLWGSAKAIYARPARGQGGGRNDQA